MKRCSHTPKTSLWLSVDPLADKYPEWSPYNYTMNNPIKFVDPDGRRPLDLWKIDSNGNTRLIKKTDDGLYINGTKMSSFDFSDNTKAFKQIHQYYAKQAKLQTTTKIYVNQFNNKGSLLESDIPFNYKIRKTPASMSAFSKKMSGDESGIVTHLWDGKVYDATNYDNKYNLMNTLVHEYEHIVQNKKTYSSFEELQIMVKQMKHESWSKTSKRYQLEVKGYWDSKYESLKKHYENSENGRSWLKYFKSSAKFEKL